MSVYLEPLDQANLPDCFFIAVTEVQMNHAQIPETDEILDRALKDESGLQMVIRRKVDHVVMGLATISQHPSPPTYKIEYLLIDQKYQGEGYGTDAMRKLLAYLCAQPDCDGVGIRYMEFNVIARSLYAKLGFVEVHSEDGYVDAEIRCCDVERLH